MGYTIKTLFDQHKTIENTRHFTTQASYSAGAWSYMWSYQGPCFCQVHTWYCLINVTCNSCTIFLLSIVYYSLLSRWQWNLWQTKFYCCELEDVEVGPIWEWDQGRHLPWPPSLGRNFPSQLQIWQKAADQGSENALIVARLQNFFKMNYITKTL